MASTATRWPHQQGCPTEACEGGEEVCDGIDNDCDGQVDERVRGACGCRAEERSNCVETDLMMIVMAELKRFADVSKAHRPLLRGPPETAGVGECRMGPSSVCLVSYPTRDLRDVEIGSDQRRNCNGLDDDCDGTIDENPANGNACGRCGPPSRTV